MRGELYPWQKECLDRWFANQGRGMVQAVTGSGKTTLALSAMDRLNSSGDGNLQVRIVVPTGALARQWQKALKQWYSENEEYRNFPDKMGREIAVCGAGNSEAKNRSYMIYVINSARYRLARRILQDLQEHKTVLLIADECHHYDSEQNRLIFEFLPHIAVYEKQFYSMGLSATLPKGENATYLTSVLGKVIYNYGVREAVKKNTICRYDVFHISIAFSEVEEDEYQELTERMRKAYLFLKGKGLLLDGESKRDLFQRLSVLAKSENAKVASNANTYIRLTYRREKLICMASARIPCACHLIEALGVEEKILVFGERIEQVNELYQRLDKKYPGRIGRYHSQMGQRANQNTLERFRHNDIRVLITCKAVDEGVDVPDISVGIVLSGTATQRQRVQRLGRIVRRAEGKDRAALYYLHLKDSSEEQVFLPEIEGADILELEYQIREDKLCHPMYDEKADILLQDIQKVWTDDERLKEVRRVLQQGKVRADWVNGHCDYEAKLEMAADTKERNYWVCMKRLSQI